MQRLGDRSQSTARVAPLLIMIFKIVDEVSADAEVFAVDLSKSSEPAVSGAIPKVGLLALPSAIAE